MGAGVAAGPQVHPRCLERRGVCRGGFRPRPFGPGRFPAIVLQRSPDGSFARRLRFRWSPEGKWVRHWLAPLPRASSSEASGLRFRDFLPEGSPSRHLWPWPPRPFPFPEATRRPRTEHDSLCGPAQGVKGARISIFGDKAGYKPVDCFAGCRSRFAPSPDAVFSRPFATPQSFAKATGRRAPGRPGPSRRHGTRCRRPTAPRSGR